MKACTHRWWHYWWPHLQLWCHWAVKWRVSVQQDWLRVDFHWTHLLGSQQELGCSLMLWDCCCLFARLRKQESGLDCWHPMRGELLSHCQMRQSDLNSLHKGQSDVLLRHDRICCKAEMQSLIQASCKMLNDDSFNTGKHCCERIFKDCALSNLKIGPD